MKVYGPLADSECERLQNQDDCTKNDILTNKGTVKRIEVFSLFNSCGFGARDINIR